MDDEKLNQIRLDATLFHIPKSDGSYVGARSGTRTRRGDKAKEKVITHNENAACDDDVGEVMVANVRRCPPRCIVCCAINDPRNKDTKITKTTIYFSVCLVSLCTCLLYTSDAADD